MPPDTCERVPRFLKASSAVRREGLTAPCIPSEKPLSACSAQFILHSRTQETGIHGTRRRSNVPSRFLDLMPLDALERVSKFRKKQMSAMFPKCPPGLRRPPLEGRLDDPAPQKEIPQRPLVHNPFYMPWRWPLEPLSAPGSLYCPRRSIDMGPLDTVERFPKVWNKSSNMDLQ